ncbi:MAG TPA: FAD binding domain-containing protein [Solirubrobacterales bacterium]|nr:FAD binding domain-containing protein [Solirubrobacterales bacterium]
MVEEYALPATPEEAVRLVADDPDAVVMGGGTTLMPRATLGELNGRRVIGLARAGIDQVRSNGMTTLGAMTPLRALTEIDDVPLLANAARSIGSQPLRVTATVGGNLLVGAPYGDLVPALLALDAEIGVAGANGERRLPLAEALEQGGVVAPGELLLEVAVPPVSGATGYHRCARREANAPPVVAVAARLRRDGGSIADARVAIGAVGSRAVRAADAEAALTGSAGSPDDIDAAVAAATAAVEPADDSVASAWYRARMTEVSVRRALEAALGEAGS